MNCVTTVYLVAHHNLLDSNFGITRLASSSSSNLKCMKDHKKIKSKKNKIILFRLYHVLLYSLNYKYTNHWFVPSTIAVVPNSRSLSIYIEN